jgi:hypothetical protein
MLRDDGVWWDRVNFQTKAGNVSMDVYARSGQKVVFANRNAGYPGERERVWNLLTVGGEYTIERTDVGQSYTTVWLKELPGERFNSVFFNDIPQGTPMNDTIHALLLILVEVQNEAENGLSCETKSNLAALLSDPHTRATIKAAYDIVGEPLYQREAALFGNICVPA